MQRIFFHNRYSQESREILETLPADVQVIDVFAVPKPEIPTEYKLSKLPYLVDKEIKLVTIPPYIAGVFTLEFNCLDYGGSFVLGDGEYTIYLNGNPYSTRADDGKISIEVECELPQTLEIKIEADEFVPFATEIEVLEGGT